MHTSLYLLITISVLAGFFMRPLNMFVFGKAISVVKYVNSKPLIFLLLFGSMLTTQGVTIGTIYLSLKLSGFIPLGDKIATFVVSFFVGIVLWIIYAKLTDHQCPVDLG